MKLMNKEEYYDFKNEEIRKFQSLLNGDKKIVSDNLYTILKGVYFPLVVPLYVAETYDPSTPTISLNFLCEDAEYVANLFGKITEIFNTTLLFNNRNVDLEENKATCSLVYRSHEGLSYQAWELGVRFESHYVRGVWIESLVTAFSEVRPVIRVSLHEQWIYIKGQIKHWQKEITEYLEETEKNSDFFNDKGIWFADSYLDNTYLAFMSDDEEYITKRSGAVMSEVIDTLKTKPSLHGLKVTKLDFESKYLEEDGKGIWVFRTGIQNEDHRDLWWKAVNKILRK